MEFVQQTQLHMYLQLYRKVEYFFSFSVNEFPIQIDSTFYQVDYLKTPHVLILLMTYLDLHQRSFLFDLKTMGLFLFDYRYFSMIHLDKMLAKLLIIENKSHNLVSTYLIREIWSNQNHLQSLI